MHYNLAGLFSETVRDSFQLSSRLNTVVPELVGMELIVSKKKKKKGNKAYKLPSAAGFP